jgi:hypothetical protein
MSYNKPDDQRIEASPTGSELSKTDKEMDCSDQHQ